MFLILSLTNISIYNQTGMLCNLPQLYITTINLEKAGNRMLYCFSIKMFLKSPSVFLNSSLDILSLFRSLHQNVLFMLFKAFTLIMKEMFLRISKSFCIISKFDLIGLAKYQFVTKQILYKEFLEIINVFDFLKWKDLDCLYSKSTSLKIKSFCFAFVSSDYLISKIQSDVLALHVL